MRPIQSWFDEYGESHRNPVNTAIHWICVPTIHFSVVGLLVSIPPPNWSFGSGHHFWAIGGICFSLGFYFSRSRPIAVGMALFDLLCLMLALTLEERADSPLWAICLVLFTLAWVGQFIGHRIEGKKPSFLKDLAFLLVGPAWLLAKLYRRFGITY